MGKGPRACKWLLEALLWLLGALARLVPLSAVVGLLWASASSDDDWVRELEALPSYEPDDHGIKITDKMIQQQALMMQWQLQDQRLDVVLVPALFGDGMIRQVVGQNPEWYRDFCASYDAGRKRPRVGKKHDTLIKRQGTISGLAAIVRGEYHTVYAQRLLPVVKAEALRIEKMILLGEFKGE